MRKNKTTPFSKVSPLSSQALSSLRRNRSTSLSNLLKGMGSVLEIFPPSSPFPLSIDHQVSGPVSDAKALRSDWERVGSSFQSLYSLCPEGYDAPLPPQENPELFTGPLPPPEIMAGYAQIDPTLVDRFFDMAQQQHAHRINMDAKERELERIVVDATINDQIQGRWEVRRGQVLGFAIGVISILAGSWTAVQGQPWAGGVIGSTGVVGLVFVVVVGNRGKSSPQETTPEPEEEAV